MEIFVLLGLIVLNGLFAMSEIAIVTAKKSRLMALAAKGNSSAQVALRLAEEPTQFLSTEPFALRLQGFGMPVNFSDNFATALVVMVVTYFSIVMGELVPKRIAQLNAERIACVVAKPMQILAIIAKPFVYFLSGSTRALMRMMGFHHTQSQQVTEEDIHAILDEGSSSGVLEQQEHAMVKNVLRLETRSIVSLMVPRSDIVYLDTALPLEENYQRVMKSPHSRFPVCTKQNDNLIGVINAKELLAEAIRGSTVDLESMAQPCHVVPESLTGMELLEFFRSSHSQMVFVVDEYGDLKGIVTLQDLLEALTGEFILGEGEDAYVIHRDDGSLLLDGMLPIMDLKDCLAIDDLPEEGNYQTLNGLIMLLMGRMPATGDKVVIQNWQLEIVDMDGRRIDKVLAYCIAEE